MRRRRRGSACWERRRNETEVVVRFIEVTRDDGTPLTVNVDTIRELRRDGPKHAAVIEYTHRGTFTVLRTPYEDVVRLLDNERDGKGKA